MDFPLRRGPVHTTLVPNGLAWGAVDQSQLRMSPSPSRPLTPSRPRWVVQKFGGTSVGKFAREIAKDIIGAGSKGDHRLAVVCSARSSSTKSEGTTNRLLRAAREAEKRGSRKYIPLVDAIRDEHTEAANENIQSPELVEQLVDEINEECDGLVKILESAQHLEEVSARAEDRIVSKGEKLSCRFMATLLQDAGVKATFVDLSDILRSNSSPAHRVDEAFYLQIAKRLAERVRECGDSVPVITGYFGSIPGGLLNTIGRGYTDLCAALVALGLKAEELQIWKEVDGIFTADPRKVPTARLLDSVTPAEAAELTFYGSEVIHPFTMEQVIRARIPIRIKNVMNPRNAGTVIYPDPEEEFTKQKLMQDGRLIRTRHTANGIGLQRTPKRPTAVTVKHNIVILNVHSNKRTRSHGFLMKIFSILDKWHLTVDLISSSEVHVSLALHSETAMLSGTYTTGCGTPNDGCPPEPDDLSIEDADLWGAVNELKEFGMIDLVNNMAIVSLVGKQLRNMVGISGKFFSTLGNNNINIEMISQGASEINISCVIDEREADRALNVVHTSLFTFLD